VTWLKAKACYCIPHPHVHQYSFATMGRFMRVLRSIFVPTTTIIVFSCLLTFFFVLYQPTRGPGDLQRLGWQSWDTISPLSTGGLSSDVDDVDHPQPTSGDHDADVDWWNVTASASANQSDSASLPLDVWNPLLPHDTGCMPLVFPFCSIFQLSAHTQCLRSPSFDVCLT
jgi:hypothetical protein